MAPDADEDGDTDAEHGTPRDAEEPDPHAHLARGEPLAPLVEEYGPLELDPEGDPFERFTVTPDGLLAVDGAAREGRLDRFAMMDDAAVVDDPTDIHGVGTWTAKTSAVSERVTPNV